MKMCADEIEHLVEKLIAIRDNKLDNWEDRDTIADACNILENLKGEMKNEN